MKSKTRIYSRNTIFLIVGICAVLFAWTINLISPNVNEADAVPAPDDKNSVEAEPKQITTIACVGDSITYGKNIDNRMLNSYPAVLGAKLGEDFRVYNYGASGYAVQKNSDYPYWNHYNFLASSLIEPDVVFLMLGTNDAKTHNWTDINRFMQDYDSLVKYYLSLPSHPKVYLMTPATRFYTDGKYYEYSLAFSDRIQEISDGIRKYGTDTGLEVIDINQVTMLYPEYFLIDGVHPDANGAALIAQTVFNAYNKSIVYE